jgi:hypothetical protein
LGVTECRRVQLQLIIGIIVIVSLLEKTGALPEAGGYRVYKSDLIARGLVLLNSVFELILIKNVKPVTFEEPD